MKNPFKKIQEIKTWKVLLVTAIILAAVGGKTLLTFAEQFVDSFLDTTRIASTWNMQVDTGAGEVKLAARSCNDSTEFCSASTTCSGTLGDGDYIIVARADASSTKQWKIANTACDTPECGTDGGQDGDNLVADNTVNFNSYPARDYCKAIGARLPTKTEQACIYTNRATFGNNFEADPYWSETEYSASYAWYTYFSDGFQSYNDKTNDYYVRCVRGW